MNTSEWDEAVVIALGSNLKGPWSSTRELLEAALARFRSEGLDVTHQSSWWRSAAWPDPDEPPFLNAVSASSMSRATSPDAFATAAGTFASSALISRTISSGLAASMAAVAGFRCSVRRASRNESVIGP